MKMSNHILYISLHPAVANVTTAVDIYSFGMCALEVSDESAMCTLHIRRRKSSLQSVVSLQSLCSQMAVLEISNGESSYVSPEAINSAIQSLEDPLQRVSSGLAFHKKSAQFSQN